MSGSSPNRIPSASLGLQHAVDDAKTRIGLVPLSDEDLLVLCCGEISHTFTRDEKGYAAA